MEEHKKRKSKLSAALLVLAGFLRLGAVSRLPTKGVKTAKVINSVFLLMPLLVLSLVGCTIFGFQNNNLIESVIPVKKSSGWWELRHNEKINQAKNTEIDLLMIGDSITHGWENAGKEVWKEFYQDKNAMNLGFSGDRTEHVLWRIQNGAVHDVTPKLIVLMIGTNNTGHRMVPAGHTAKGISTIISELRIRLPMSKILLVGIFPRQHSSTNILRQRNNEVNQLISKLDDNEVVFYLNINEVFLDKNKILDTKIMPDLLHPSRLGYQLWAEAMTATINRLME